MSEQEAYLRDAVADPMVVLRRELRAGDLGALPSRVVAERSGVPASVVRDIRNRTAADVKTSTWARLMRWVLSERDREDARRGAA